MLLALILRIMYEQVSVVIVTDHVKLCHDADVTSLQGGISLPKVLSLPSLVPTFQSGLSDLARDSFGNFEELESLANGIPNLTRNVRQTVSELSSQATAVRGALMAALPVLNLPDWGLGMTTEPGEDSASRPAPTWQERLGAAVTTVVQHMELDTLFVRTLLPCSSSLPRPVRCWL